MSARGVLRIIEGGKLGFYCAEHPHDPSPFHCERCHSFVTNGEIRFLSDCTHPLGRENRAAHVAAVAHGR